MKKAFLLLILFVAGGIYGCLTKVRPKTIQEIKSYRLSPKEGKSQGEKVALLEKALKDSPLASQAATFVSVANKYNLDFRLLPAIAFAESTLCRYSRIGSYNCWGWMDGRYNFRGLEEAISEIAEKLNSLPVYSAWRQNKENLSLLASTYCPQNRNAWQKMVEYFLEKIK